MCKVCVSLETKLHCLYRFYFQLFEWNQSIDFIDLKWAGVVGCSAVIGGVSRFLEFNVVEAVHRKVPFAESNGETTTRGSQD